MNNQHFETEHSLKNVSYSHHAFCGIKKRVEFVGFMMKIVAI